MTKVIMVVAAFIAVSSGRVFGRVGDCDSIGGVSAAEATTCFQIMRGEIPLSSCMSCDADGNGSVSSDEWQMALNNSLGCCTDRVECSFDCIPTPTVTPTFRRFCAGDCDANGEDIVRSFELQLCSQVAAGERPVADCPNCDADGDGTVTSDEFACAMMHLESGCPSNPGPNGGCVLPTLPPGTTRTPTPTRAVPTSTPNVPTNTPNAGPTHTPGGTSCVGDCNGDHVVMVNELVTGVNIALDRAELSGCMSFDGNSSLHVEINEVVTGVNNLLRGCP